MGHDDKDGLLFAVQVEQELPDLPSARAIEVAGRLIGEEQHWLQHQRPSDGDALPFPAGQLGGPMLQPLAEADALQQLARERLELGRVPLTDQCGNEDVFQHGALRQEVMVLKDETDVPVAVVGEAAFAEGERILAVEPHGAGSRPVERAEDVQQRALARAGRPHDGEGVAALHLQADAAQHGQRAGARGIFFTEVLDLQRHWYESWSLKLLPDLDLSFRAASGETGKGGGVTTAACLG